MWRTILAILTVVLVFVAFMGWYVHVKYRYWYYRRIPHKKPRFPYGNLQEWRKTKHLIDIINPLYMKNRNQAAFVGLYMYLRPVVVCTSLELAKRMLIDDFFNFEHRGCFNNERNDALTGDLFRLDGPKWYRLRQGVTSAFSSSNMEGMFISLCHMSIELAAACEQLADNTVGRIVEMNELVARYTSDVYGRCAFGIGCNALNNPNTAFYVMGKRARTERRHGLFIDGLMECYPKLARKLFLRKLHPEIAQFYMRIVRETVAERERLPIRHDDFMNSLIEMKRRKELNVEEVAAQAFNFFMSGIETTASTLTYILYELAKQPHMQSFLRDELDAAIVRHGDFNYNAVMDLKYMELVIAETLRKYPPLPYITRISRYRYSPATNRSFYIDPGQMIIIPIYAIHHDPEIYPQPELFKPERFSVDGFLRRPICAWLPYGDGQRNCLGMRFCKMQMCIALSCMLRNFKFCPCPRTVRHIQFDKSSVMLIPTTGIYLKMERLR